MALIALLLLHGIPSGSVYNPTGVTLFSMIFGSLVMLYPFVRNVLYDKDLLDPAVVVGGLLFAYFPLRGFSIGVMGLPSPFPSFIAATDKLLAPFTAGLIIISIGSIAYYAGHRLSFRGPRTPIWPSVSRRTVLLPNLLAIWALSIAVHFLLTVEVITSGNAILYHVTSWHYLAVLVLLAYNFSSGRDHISWIVVGAILFVEVALVTVIEFSLNSLLMLLTFSTLAYHYLGPGVTVKKISMLSGGIIVLFPISTIAERVQAGDSLLEAIAQGTLGSYWGLERFFNRMIGTDALTMIVARTPEVVQFQGGETLLFAIYGLIPRAIWSGKPSIIMCGVNNQYFSGRGADANTCAAMTVPGELYWNFGTAGIIVGLFAIGLLLGLVYRWFMNGTGGPKNCALIVIYSLVLLQIMRFESGFGQLVSNLIKGVGFAAIFLWFVTEPRDKRGFRLTEDSAFERSRLFQVSRSIVNTVSPNSSIVVAWSMIGCQWIKNIPRKIASTAKSSPTPLVLRTFVQPLSNVWFEPQAKLHNAWDTSRIQSFLQGSMMYRLVKKLH